jgi:hypothetical protein
MKFSISLGVLGLLGVASAIPAAAGTVNLDLNTGNGSDPYTITSDTLSPSEGTTVYLVTTTATNWISNLTSDWIAPQANQSNAVTQGVEADSGSVTYDTTFVLPVGFTSPNLAITMLADDWATISLNGQIFYNGPTGPDVREWLADNVISTTGADSDLVAGLNTLQFVVYNIGGGTDAGGGPTGLNAQVSLGYTTAATPEPSTVLPLAAAVLLGGFALRRRRLAA